ncbi:MAG: hypothetical protein ACD_62C00384G0005 [uncultured bacterium]|nr:MAG: hypothetical protein ACD_62C00384G0005 [uncultured bacterium]
MQTYLHDKPIKYDGTQLVSHFAYNHFNLLGDAIVSFMGPCDVKIDQLVDLEDVHQNAFIFSENMLHFIVEHFHDDLLLTIAWQRLLIDLIISEMKVDLPGGPWERRGDDIYDDVFKVSVSIATRSPVSCLIHTGINISSNNTPVLTKGLDDYHINPQALATGVMNRYRAEIESMRKARAKVRGVG